jgi:hypothetical protein
MLPAAAMAQSAPGVVTTQAAADAEMLSKIFGARGDSFAMLRGEAETHDRGGRVSWAASVSPFHMRCQIVSAPEGTRYRCTNTGETPRNGDPQAYGGDSSGTMFDESVMSDMRLSPHEYWAAINVTTLSTNGEEESARVTLTIFSHPLSQDPSQS